MKKLLEAVRLVLRSPMRWLLITNWSYLAISITYFLTMAFLHRKVPRPVTSVHFVILGWFLGYAFYGYWRARREFKKSEASYRKAAIAEIFQLVATGFLDYDRERPAMEELLYVASILVSTRLVDPKGMANEIAILENWLEHWGIRVGAAKQIDAP